MVKSNDTTKYLENLVEYSNNVYNTTISKIPSGIKWIITDDNNESHINDVIIEIFAEILGIDLCNGKISVYEMAYVLIYLSERVFGINKILKETNIEMKIFKNLLDNIHDETVSFLINGNNLIQ